MRVPAQRRQVRCGNRKLRSQMTPERSGYHGYGIERPGTAIAKKTYRMLLHQNQGDPYRRPRVIE